MYYVLYTFLLDELAFYDGHVTFIFLSSRSTCELWKRFKDVDAIPWLPIEVDTIYKKLKSPLTWPST